MATWYRVSRSSSRLQDIEEVHVLKTTSKTLTVQGSFGTSIVHKSTEYDDYFSTWDEAADYLLTRLGKAANAYRQRMEEGEQKFNAYTAALAAERARRRQSTPPGELSNG